MTDTIEDIIESFSLLDSWEDRYRYIIDLGRSLPPLASEEKVEAHKISGCVSQVWLVATRDPSPDQQLHFKGDSDAHIVRGLVAILLAFYNNKTAVDILSADIEGLFTTLNLRENLTPQRANGLKSMISRIQAEAHAALNNLTSP
ncbi:SufE family protein [Bartonella sp. DGB2]|uniref:SufE family protein n=1 Tax=Bartonella sp. DGB2 TaxID=3388426 RepID=UPI00398FF45D